MNHRQQYAHYFESRAAYEDALMRSYKARDEAIMKHDEEKKVLDDEYEFIVRDHEITSRDYKNLKNSLPNSRIVWTKEQKLQYGQLRSKLNEANRNKNIIMVKLLHYQNKCSDAGDIAFEEKFQEELNKAKSKISQKNLVQT